jgi:rhodanese-related sulfurtransferase
MSINKIVIAAAAIIGVGGAIGLADMAMRKGKLLLERPEPPPIESVLASRKPREVPTSQVQPETAPNVETPAPTDQNPAQTTAQAAPAGELPKGHITIEQASGLYDQQAFFVDARRKEVYVEGHVANAFRADMESFKNSTPSWVSALPKDMLLVVYCNGGDCDESEHVAQLLNASGFTAVYIMHDGFPGWKSAGLPVETGEGQE